MQTQQSDKSGNFAIFDVAAMLTASKRRSHRQATLLTAEATANIFTDEHLSHSDLRARFMEKDDQFVISGNDLTDEGLAFARAGYQNWLANASRWTTARSLPKLEDALRKQVAAFRRASG